MGRSTRLVIEDSVFLFKSFVAARFDNDNMYEVGVLVGLCTM